MRKFLLAIAAFALSLTVTARPTGLNLGGGISTDFIYNSNSTDTFLGSFLEIGYDLDFTPIVGMYFAARYSIDFRLAYEYDAPVQSAGFTFKSNIELPVHLILNIPAGKNTVFFNLGPTLDFWTGYRTVMVSTSAEEPIRIVNHFDNDIFNRVNVDLGGKVGINIKNHVKVYAAYDQSLINLYKDSSQKCSAGQLRIGAAYVF